MTAAQRRLLGFGGATVAVGLAWAAVVSVVGPASTVGVFSGSAASYRSSVTAIQPSVAGLTVSLSKSGESVTLNNQTGKVVVVLGYAGEQYLRITPAGSYENTNSLSTALNNGKTLQGMSSQLAGDALRQPATWKLISTSPTFTWNDHRTRWMTDERPPVVVADPQHAHPVFDWAMQLLVDGKPIIVEGAVTWIGAPWAGTTTTVLVSTGVALVLGLVGVTVLRRGRRLRGPGNAPWGRRDLTPARASSHGRRAISATSR